MHEIIGTALMSGAFFFSLGMLVGEKWRDWTREEEEEDWRWHDEHLMQVLREASEEIKSLERDIPQIFGKQAD